MPESAWSFCWYFKFNSRLTPLRRRIFFFCSRAFVVITQKKSLSYVSGVLIKTKHHMSVIFRLHHERNYGYYGCMLSDDTQHNSFLTRKNPRQKEMVNHVPSEVELELDDELSLRSGISFGMRYWWLPCCECLRIIWLAHYVKSFHTCIASKNDFCPLTGRLTGRFVFMPSEAIDNSSCSVSIKSELKF